jgi:hypothetical protein
LASGSLVRTVGNSVKRYFKYSYGLRPLAFAVSIML